MLYRSTDRLCRCGAPVQYLSHSASFHSLEKYAPPNAGTKHLVLKASPKEQEMTELGSLLTHRSKAHGLVPRNLAKVRCDDANESARARIS
jgi:hypothetical protein